MYMFILEGGLNWHPTMLGFPLSTPPPLSHSSPPLKQVHQVVDEDGGWPLEVLLPHGRVGEVYLQAGEMVLYEGAWLRHGRPMRFKGDEFANIFRCV